MPVHMCSDLSSGKVSVVQLCREIAARKETPYRALCFRLRCSLCPEYAGTPEPATLVSTHLVECTSSVGGPQQGSKFGESEYIYDGQPCVLFALSITGNLARAATARKRFQPSSHFVVRAMSCLQGEPTRPHGSVFWTVSPCTRAPLFVWFSVFKCMAVRSSNNQDTGRERTASSAWPGCSTVRVRERD